MSPHGPGPLWIPPSRGPGPRPAVAVSGPHVAGSKSLGALPCMMERGASRSLGALPALGPTAKVPQGTVLKNTFIELASIEEEPVERTMERRHSDSELERHSKWLQKQKEEEDEGFSGSDSMSSEEQLSEVDESDDEMSEDDQGQDEDSDDSFQGSVDMPPGFSASYPDFASTNKGALPGFEIFDDDVFTSNLIAPEASSVPSPAHMGGEQASLGTGSASLDMADLADVVSEGMSDILVDGNPSTDTELNGRTTVMIQGVPSQYTQRKLMLEVNYRGFMGCYDFMYLPMQPRKNSNRGFAFVNFTTPESAEEFFQALNGKKLHYLNTTSVIGISPAKVQGFEENVVRFAEPQSSSSSRKRHPKPLIFRSMPSMPNAMNVKKPPLTNSSVGVPHKVLQQNWQPDVVEPPPPSQKRPGSDRMPAYLDTSLTSSSSMQAHGNWRQQQVNSSHIDLIEPPPGVPDQRGLMSTSSPMGLGSPQTGSRPQMNRMDPGRLGDGRLNPPLDPRLAPDSRSSGDFRGLAQDIMMAGMPLPDRLPGPPNDFYMSDLPPATRPGANLQAELSGYDRTEIPQRGLPPPHGQPMDLPPHQDIYGDRPLPMSSMMGGHQSSSSSRGGRGVYDTGGRLGERTMPDRLQHPGMSPNGFGNSYPPGNRPCKGRGDIAFNDSPHGMPPANRFAMPDYQDERSPPSRYPGGPPDFDDRYAPGLHRGPPEDLGLLSPHQPQSMGGMSPATLRGTPGGCMDRGQPSPMMRQSNFQADAYDRHRHPGPPSRYAGGMPDEGPLQMRPPHRDHYGYRDMDDHLGPGPCQYNRRLPPDDGFGPPHPRDYYKDDGFSPPHPHHGYRQDPPPRPPQPRRFCSACGEQRLKMSLRFCHACGCPFD
eukprot:TRINITY_DN5658_c0_g1_i4.p1 TRINITY_DN5658_c0_g1~~TRINITY_DN5658_c0_g1_i4.p1  ORF type:complete len:877 (+),score=110.10 TRINITY_DN5658_c0_g1_i4:120-2750(+)